MLYSFNIFRLSYSNKKEFILKLYRVRVNGYLEKILQKCCTKTLRELQHLVLDDPTNSDYVVRKGAMLGDLNEIRSECFERRYHFNVSKTSTYVEAYKKTEDEYVKTFGKRRYSSYDSLMNVRNRYVTKK